MATANNTEVIIGVFRKCLRLSHLMIRLRSFRLWIWQAHNCDIVGKAHWMQHNQEATIYELIEHSKHNNEELQRQHPFLFWPRGPVEKAMIEWMYTLLGFVSDKEEAVPWVISKSKLFFIAATKADFATLRRVVVWHDTAFTLARQYPMEAVHNIEHIYHQYLASSLSRKY